MMARCECRGRGDCAACLDALRAELREWRSGKRRVVWRLRWKAGSYEGSHDHTTRKLAMGVRRYFILNLMKDVSVRRVTVGPAKKKEAG